MDLKSHFRKLTYNLTQRLILPHPSLTPPPPPPPPPPPESLERDFSGSWRRPGADDTPKVTVACRRSWASSRKSVSPYERDFARSWRRPTAGDKPLRGDNGWPLESKRSATKTSKVRALVDLLYQGEYIEYF